MFTSRSFRAGEPTHVPLTLRRPSPLDPSVTQDASFKVPSSTLVIDMNILSHMNLLHGYPRLQITTHHFFGRIRRRVMLTTNLVLKEPLLGMHRAIRLLGFSSLQLRKTWRGPSLAINGVPHGIEMRSAGTTERMRTARTKHGLESYVKSDLDELENGGETCAHECNGNFKGNEDLGIGNVPWCKLVLQSQSRILRDLCFLHVKSFCKSAPRTRIVLRRRTERMMTQYPATKTPIRANLRDVSMRKAHSMGIGSTKMTKSMTMLEIVAPRNVLRVVRQWPGSMGFQALRTGMQVKSARKLIATNHPMINAAVT